MDVEAVVVRKVPWCEANIRKTHPQGEERPCTRKSVRDVYVCDAFYSFCEQHAKQADAGMEVFDPKRAALHRK